MSINEFRYHARRRRRRDEAMVLLAAVLATGKDVRVVAASEAEAERLMKDARRLLGEIVADAVADPPPDYPEPRSQSEGDGPCRPTT